MSTTSRRRPLCPPPVVLPTRYHHLNMSINQTMRAMLPTNGPVVVKKSNGMDDHRHRSRQRGFSASSYVDEHSSRRSSDLSLNFVDQRTVFDSAGFYLVSLDNSCPATTDVPSPMQSMYTCDTALESTLGPVPITLHTGLTRNISLRTTASSLDTYDWSCDTSQHDRHPALRVSAAPRLSMNQFGNMPVSPTMTTTGRSLRSIRSSMGAMNAKVFAAHAADLLHKSSRRTSASSPFSSEEQSMESNSAFVANLPLESTPRSSSIRQQRVRSGFYYAVETEGEDEHKTQRAGWRRRSATLAALLSPEETLSVRASADQRPFNVSGWLISPAPTERTLESSMSFVTAVSARDGSVPMCRTDASRCSNLPVSPSSRDVTSCRSPLLLAHIGDLKHDTASLLPMSVAASTPSRENCGSNFAKSHIPSSRSPTRLTAPLRKISSLNDLRGALFAGRNARAKKTGEQKLPQPSNEVLSSPIQQKTPNLREGRSTYPKDNCLGMALADFDWKDEWDAGRLSSEEANYPIISTRNVTSDHSPLLSPPFTSTSHLSASSSKKSPDPFSVDSAILAVFPKPPSWNCDDQKCSTSKVELPDTSPVTVIGFCSPHRYSRYARRDRELHRAEAAAPSKSKTSSASPPVPLKSKNTNPGPQDISSRFSSTTSTDEAATLPARSNRSGSALSSPISDDVRPKFGGFGLPRLPSRSVFPAPSPASPTSNGNMGAKVSPSSAEGRADIDSRRSTVNGGDDTVIQSTVRPLKSFRGGRALIARVLNPSAGNRDREDEKSVGRSERRPSIHCTLHPKMSYAEETIEECDETPFVFCPTLPSERADRGGVPRQRTLRNVLSKRSLLTAGLGSRFS